MKKKTKFRVVELDESDGWNEDILKAVGGKITTVYLYDEGIKTHCCELTPSYYLIPLYHLTPNFPLEDNNEDREHSRMEVDGYIEMKPIYVHCGNITPSNIDISYLDKKYKKPYGKRYNKILDEVEDYLKCNWPV